MRQILIIIFFAVIVMMAGCGVGPEYRRPASIIDVSSDYRYLGENPNDVSFDPNYLWWQNFADETTNDLVSEALANNYSIKSAAQRVIQSQASLEQAIGAQLPNINYGFGRERSRSNFFLGGLNIQSIESVYNQNISASYSLDLFGKLKQAKQAAWAELLSSRASQIAVTNSLIASVVKTRVAVETLKRQKDIIEKTIDSRERTLDIVERRYKYGRVESIDVRFARENLAVARAVLPEIELSLAKTLMAVDTLLAKKLGSTNDLPSIVLDVPNLSPIPMGLPGSLLDRRPDVIAAELKLKAQNERVGVSIAQLYPDLTLTGSYGFRGQEFENAFNDDYEVYSLILNAAMPLWQGGALRSNIKGAKARYEELAYDYADTIINAVKEVETALVTEEKLNSRYIHLIERAEQARKAEDLSLERYSKGLEPILTYLESERRRINAENDLVLVQDQLWSNRVDLFLALGGNWTANNSMDDKNEK